MQTLQSFTLVATNYYKEKHYIMSKKDKQTNFNNNIQAEDGYEEEMITSFRNIDNKKKRVAFRTVLDTLETF